MEAAKTQILCFWRFFKLCLFSVVLWTTSTAVQLGSEANCNHQGTRMLFLVALFLLPAIVFAGVYCPSSTDLQAAYGSPSIYDRGWQINGGGGVATKAAFNLLGGSVEFDIDFTNTRTGVNGNIYTISPSFSGSFNQNNYCDGAKTGSGWCVEVDWIESNGNCGAATTLHTRDGTGNDGCTAWGCKQEYYYNGRPSFHMKISYDYSGKWTTVHDGKTIGPNDLSPLPQDYDWNQLVSQYKSKGAVIYSSQWTGWVPTSPCGTYGDLYSSSFKITNLKINGTVVNGPTPRSC
jgi:hypothetical protein